MYICVCVWYMYLFNLGRNNYIARFLFFFSLQFSPCVFQSSSSLDFYLRSTPFSCVCWSRLTCTCLVELVRINHAPLNRLHPFLVRGLICLCVLATTSPLSSLYSLLRSVLVAALVYGFCLGAINVSELFWATKRPRSLILWCHDAHFFLLYSMMYRPHGVRLMFQCSSLCSVASSLPYHTT